jgi:hypothetical protein
VNRSGLLNGAEETKALPLLLIIKSTLLLLQDALLLLQALRCACIVHSQPISIAAIHLEYSAPAKSVSTRCFTRGLD